MRYLVICSLSIFFINTSFGQVGIGTPSPHPSAGLDVTSTNSGLLPPRMTTQQRDAIVSPSPGLMIFNTSTQSIEIFTEYGWYGMQLQIPARKLFGGFSKEEAYSIQKTTDGGFIVAGNSSSSGSGDVTDIGHDIGNGGFDYWIVKLDASRKIMWNKLFGGNGYELAKSIQQTSDGGYIIAGYSNSSGNGDVTGGNSGGNDYWIVKLDDIGRIEWEQLIGGSGDDKAQSIVQTTDGGYIVAGYSNSTASGNVNSTNHGGYDFWIVKLDDQGRIIWDFLLGGSGDELANSVIQAVDGTYVVAGHSTSSTNGNVTGSNHGTSYLIDYWIVRLSPTGTIIWNKLQGGSGDDEAQSIQQTTDGNYIVAGYSTSSANGDITGTNHGSGSPDFWIEKLDRFGNIIWNKLIGGDQFDRAYSIKQTSDGGYIVAGHSSSSASGDVSSSNHSNPGAIDYWIVKLDGIGNIAWDRLIGGTGFDYAQSIVQAADGGYIVAGHSNSSFSGDVTSGNHGADFDFWIIKLGSNGYLY